MLRLFFTLLAPFILSTAHMIALRHALYFKFHFLDTIMHTLGGISLTLFFYFLFEIFFPTYKKARHSVLAGGATIVFGIVWEMFELYLDRHYTHFSFNLRDTISDLFFDAVGAGIVYFFIRKR